MTLWVGLGGERHNACVALCADEGVLGVCPQERLTRVRGAGFNPTGLPDEALDSLLTTHHRTRSDVSGYAAAESLWVPLGDRRIVVDHHFGHACSAFLTSPFNSAAIVVCDHRAPEVSVWEGDGDSLKEVEWPWRGPGFATIYSKCAEALGFTPGAQEQRMEALARFDPDRRDDRAHLFHLQADGLRFPSDFQAQIANWLGSDPTAHETAGIAGALQSRIAEVLAEFMTAVRRRLPSQRKLCVGGSLFYNSHLNTKVKLAGAFDDVFVPIDPGNAGLSVGAGLHAIGKGPQPVAPFLGPSFTAEEIKKVIDNCKLKYEWLSESDVITTSVEALGRGRLLAWFEGGMEWGPRALGGRSILANPFAPYVLENLNRFLKHRQPWRGYALSALDTMAREYFHGPTQSPFMECDYRPTDREHFRHVLPGPDAMVRVHTAGLDTPPRFRALLRAFGQATGTPILANTSFNGFQEPMVCSPRDAVRVFFGTGIDILVLDQFVITK